MSTALQLPAQVPFGHYAGAVSRDGSVQLVSVDLDTVGGKLAGTLDIPELMDYEIPIPPATWRHDTLVLWVNYGNFFCRYFPSTDEITGISEGWQPKIRLHLKKADRQLPHFRREEITFRNKDVRLGGVLFIPLAKPAPPFAVLIHGSGEVDRNSDYYHSLGYALAEKGIGVLLYDKRGCGKSGGDWKTATMQDFANDAVAALEFLKHESNAQFSSVGFLGTSQGGWITAIAANRCSDCDFAILNVGPSVSVFHQDVDRVRYSMLGDGLPESSIDSAVEYSKLYFRYATTTARQDWETLRKEADRLSGRSWIGYVNVPPNDSDFVWWRNNDYDPAGDLSKMRCPVLSIFGEKDVLVPPAENETRMDSLLHLSGTPYTIKVIRSVGHDELTFQGLNGSGWQWPAVYWQWRKRPREIVDTMVGWIARLRRGE